MWYIAYLHENIFCFKKKYLPPLDPVVFFETFLPHSPAMVCETDPFSLMLQPCKPDFLTSANRIQEKSFLLSILQYLEVCQKKVYNKVIWLSKHFYENHFIHFSGDVRKTTVMKVLEIIRKTSSIAFLVKNFSCPIYPPATIVKTDSTTSVSFICS